ncbi:DNA-binding protein [bacterium]|nr:DNA-binding protein [bacterium]
MVDINGKSYSDIIKIKGTDKKIDLTKLEGLQRTEQNKVIFDMVDKNKDGVINKEEARMLQGNLLTGSGGNGKLSKSEANNAYGKQMNAFEAISALADQQKAIGEGKEYIEQNGKSTTRIYNSNVSDEYSYRADTDENGVTTTRLNDGSQEIQHKDGSRQEIKSDGTVISYDKDGKKTSVIIDGNTTTFPDANNSITKNAEGKVIQTTSFNDGVIVRTDFEYQDGKTIERAYSDVGDNAPLTGITVKEKKDGHNVDTKFATEEDMANNKPSEIVTDAHNPTQKTVTKFTYNEDGTYSTETTNSAGDKTVKNFNADGTEIVEPQKPEVPTTHTVVKGESITKIVTDALAQQGIENPTPEQLKEAKKEFLEANKDLVKTYKGVKKEWHGNKFFYPDDVVKIPNFVKEDSAAVTEGNTDSTVKGNNPTDENTEVTDENIVVDNGTEVVENQLTEEELSFINEFDSNDSSTISKEEFTALINDQLANLPPAVAEANTEQIQTLIDEAFAKIDAQNKDSELSQAELKQNFNTAVAELTGKIDQLEAASSSATTEVENDSKDTSEGSITITDGSNYDIKNDQTFITLNSEIERLNEEIRNMESQYNIKPGEPNMQKMGFDAVSTYRELTFDLRGLKRDMETYQDRMSEWQDGSTSQMTINGIPFEAKKVTLSNGQRALEIDGKYYALESNGWLPDFTKEIVLSE